MTRILICADYNDTPNYRKAFSALGVELEYGDYNSNIDEYDGLLIPGGVDVHPKYYNQEIDGSEYINEELDERQVKTIDEFVKREKPVFGICRGHQIINVYFGGTLIQDLKERDSHTQPVKYTDNINDIVAEKGSVLAKLYGKTFKSNSSHHQGVDKPGKGLKITARCTDGVVEALEHETLPIFTVQFHPERMCFDFASDKYVDGSKIIKHFIEMCKH